MSLCVLYIRGILEEYARVNAKRKPGGSKCGEKIKTGIKRKRTRK